MSAVFSSWKNLRRTPYQSLTALLVVITTFFMVYLFTTFLYFGDNVLNFFETRPQILVFFKTEITDDEATKAAALISELDYVLSVEAILKAEAMTSYIAEISDQPILAELLTPELFPVSLKITADNPAGLEAARKEIEKIEGIDEIDYRKDVIDQFLVWTHLLRDIGLATCLLFTIQFMLVIMIVTGMKVVSRRRSINIMSILGAWRSSIKGPFIAEGMWLGLLGSLIAFGLTQLVLYYISPAIIAFLGEIKVLPLPVNFLLIQMIMGSSLAAILAAFAAWVATTRLIKK